MPTIFFYLFIIYFLKCWHRMNEPKLFTFYFAIHWIKAENKNKRELKKKQTYNCLPFILQSIRDKLKKKIKELKKQKKIFTLYFANKGNNKITELRTILQRESQNS